MARSSTSGQGRKKGIPNKITRPIRELAGEHSEGAIRTLALIAGDDRQATAARVAAIRELLDRAHGRPTARIEAQLPAGSPAEVGHAAIQAALSGHLPIEQLQAVMGAISQQARIVESAELLTRLEYIESLVLKK
jgi:type IV pilus biogenesis protein CpaD/CtpE